MPVSTGLRDPGKWLKLRPRWRFVLIKIGRRRSKKHKSGFANRLPNGKLDDLKQIVGEVKPNSDVVLGKVIRAKKDAVQWIQSHWDIPEKIVGLWFAQKAAIADQENKLPRAMKSTLKFRKPLKITT